MQAVDPSFEFTDPPFRHSLAMTLALAAAGNRPAAVLTGPAIAARSQAWPIRRSRLADTYGMVRVSLQHHPLTASAALVWSDDLPPPPPAHPPTPPTPPAAPAPRLAAARASAILPPSFAPAARTAVRAPPGNAGSRAATACPKRRVSGTPPPTPPPLPCWPAVSGS